MIKKGKYVVIYDGVSIGDGSVIEDFVVLGKSPKGHEPGELSLNIGSNAAIRTGTVIYAGNDIGDYFNTGDNARIREDNVIGDHVSIGTNTVIECGCSIGDYVRIHSNCFICEYTTIENMAWIGPGVILTNVLHPPCPAFKQYAPIKEAKCCQGPVIKEGAVVGAGAIILPGVTIGRGALVGAGAVVVDDVPDQAVVAGVPARVLKQISELECVLGFYKKGEIYSWRRIMG